MVVGSNPVAVTLFDTVRTYSKASTADSGSHKKVLNSGPTTLVISNEEINDIVKIVKSHGNSGIFSKGNGNPITNEAKEERDNFFSMLLCILGASVLIHFRKYVEWTN